jgi:hypothetical protein
MPPLPALLVCLPLTLLAGSCQLSPGPTLPPNAAPAVDAAALRSPAELAQGLADLVFERPPQGLVRATGTSTPSTCAAHAVRGLGRVIDPLSTDGHAVARAHGGGTSPQCSPDTWLLEHPADLEIHAAGQALLALQLLIRAEAGTRTTRR